MFTIKDVDDLLVGPLLLFKPLEEAWRLSHLNLSTNPPPLVALHHRLAPVTVFGFLNFVWRTLPAMQIWEHVHFTEKKVFIEQLVLTWHVLIGYQIPIQKVKILELVILHPNRSGPSTPKKASSGGIHPSGNSGLSSWCFAKSQRG